MVNGENCCGDVYVGCVVFLSVCVFEVKFVKMGKLWVSGSFFVVRVVLCVNDVDVVVRKIVKMFGLVVLNWCGEFKVIGVIEFVVEDVRAASASIFLGYSTFAFVAIEVSGCDCCVGVFIVKVFYFVLDEGCGVVYFF